jgi:hypothetical protein
MGVGPRRLEPQGTLEILEESLFGLVAGGPLNIEGVSLFRGLVLGPLMNLILRQLAYLKKLRGLTNANV